MADTNGNGNYPGDRHGPRQTGLDASQPQRRDPCLVEHGVSTFWFLRAGLGARNFCVSALGNLRRDERGIGIFWFLFYMTAVLVMMVLVLDFGIAFSDRRELQKSADNMALAGVLDLPDDPAAADLNARTWGTRNQVDLTSALATLSVDNTCWNDHPNDDPAIIDTVTVNLSQPATLLAMGELGIGGFNVGAHARACVGSLREAEGLRPWSISILNSECFSTDVPGSTNVYDYTPNYGEECVVRLESPSSQVGSIRLGDDPGDECGENGGGAAKYTENIEEGSDAICELGDVIDTEPGLQVGPTLTALHNLLATEGACDSSQRWGNGNGYDQLLEVFTPNPEGAQPGPDVVFSAHDCGWDADIGTPDSPRYVTLVLIDEFDTSQGFDSEPIVAFAGFFIDRCESLDSDGQVLNIYPRCNVPGGEQSNTQIVGTFVRHMRLGGAGGPLDPFGTRVVLLVE